MKIEIISTQHVKKVIDVEFPYYCHLHYGDVGGYDDSYYMIVSQKEAICIAHKGDLSPNESYSVERVAYFSNSLYSPEHQCSSKEFWDIFSKMSDFMTKIQSDFVEAKHD